MILRAITASLGMIALHAAAASFTVDTTADAIDALPGDGLCRTTNDQCSLRAAIQEANAQPDADVISLPAGTHMLSIAGRGEEDGATGDLDVTNPVEIEGVGAATTIVDGGALDRVFDLGADTTLRRLTVRNGDAIAENGGGVRAAPFGESMSVTIEDAVVTGNDALNGGGVANEDGSALTILRSTLTNNAADTSGGALNVSVLTNGTTLENVTISNNFDAGGGDGMRNEGTLTARHVTIVDDRIRNDAAAADVVLRACLLDNGTLGTCSAGSDVESGGDNLEHGTSCGLNGAGDRDGLDPLLLPLGLYGGDTPTHALSSDSPAVDAIASCALAEDQRRVARPQDGDDTGGAACDVGAFEREPGFVTTTTITTSTTTTTIPVCLSEPTFTSTACRIGSLGLRFAGAAEPIKLTGKLSGLLTKAGARLPIAEEALGLGQTKKARKQTSKASKLVRKFGKKLSGRKGPKALPDEPTRLELVGEAATLEADLVILRDSLQ